MGSVYLSLSFCLLACLLSASYSQETGNAGKFKFTLIPSDIFLYENFAHFDTFDFGIIF